VCPPVMTFLLDSLGKLVSRALLLSNSVLCRVDPSVSSLDLLPSVAVVCRDCSGSECRISALFLVLSWHAHCDFNFTRSVSAFCSSSFSSKTLLSWLARATKKPLGSFGEGIGASEGVWGNEDVFEEVGVGLVDSLVFVPVATGKLRDNLFGRLGVYESARVCFITCRGGGDIGKYVLLGEFPT